MLADIEARRLDDVWKLGLKAAVGEEPRGGDVRLQRRIFLEINDLPRKVSDGVDNALRLVFINGDARVLEALIEGVDPELAVGIDDDLGHVVVVHVAHDVSP